MNLSRAFDHNYFDGFCSDDLFVRLNETWPTFSRCFQHTVLTWLPAAYFLVTVPILLFEFNRSRALPIERTVLSWLKIIVQTVILLACVSNWASCLFYYSDNDGLISYDSIFAPLLVSVMMFLILSCIVYCQRRGFVTSGVIFTSFIWFAVCGSPEFITLIHQLKNGSGHRFGAISYCLYYSLVLLQIFLFAFADKAADYEDVERTEKLSCPENVSSFLNKITFWWFTSICITGWKRPLILSDLYNLNASDRSIRLVELWNRRWKPQYQKYSASKKRESTVDIEVNFNAETDGLRFSSNRRDDHNIRTQQAAKRDIKMPSVVWCLFLTFKELIIPSTILKTVADALQFLNPILLSAMITFIQNPKEPLWKGYFYVISMFVVSMLYTLLLHQYFHLMLRFGMNMRSVLSASLFEKVLRLSNSAQKERGVGETVNVMSTDVQRFQDTAFYINMIISNPFQICVALYFLWQQLGASVLAGVAVMILLIPLNYLISNQQRKYQVAQMKLKDDRMKLMSEILNGIKILKLYAWEESFEKKILEIRQRELKHMRKINYFMALSSFLWTCAPVFVSVATFAVYVLATGESLTAQKAFVSLALFNILRFPMSMLPVMTSVMVQASVSNKRIKSFLCAEEIEDNVVDKNPKDQEDAVQIRDGYFAWEKSKEKNAAILRDVNLAVAKGQLIAIVGKVGSGKSSLLSAILGEMERLTGYVAVSGSIAYVTQQAWIQNMSLKDNILFGKPANETLYEKVLDVCSLKPDIKILPDGDSTEIGEKGINLSGGQKQRVSLARAVYHNADVYLFDDPLSAVDAHVGKHIFEKVLSNNGILKHKTRILVTHGLHNLKNMDKIFVMNDGQITESGTYRELLDKRGAFSNILLTYLQEKVEKDLTEDNEENGENPSEVEDKEMEDAIEELKTIDPKLDRQLSAISETVHTKRRSSLREKSLPTKSKKDKSKARLTQDETAETGRVKTDVYRTYFSAMGYLAISGSLILTVISNAFIAGANFWLSKWSNDVDESQKNRSNGSGTIHGDDFYLGVYVSLGLAQGLFVLLSAILLAFATMSASRILHLMLVHRLFRAPLSFFDVTPLGRVINRCGKDVDVVDSALATTIRSWIYCVCSVLTTLTVITLAIFYFGFVVVPLAIMYYFVLRFYVSTSRQLKRLESVTRSPIFSHFQESISGVSSIRAYEVQNRFIEHSYRLMDVNQACYYCTLVSNRWLAIRLEFIGNLMVFFAAMFAVLMRNQLFGGEVGLAISYALAVTQTLNWAVRMTSDLETNIVSVERIKEYSEIQIEAEWISDVRPVKEWPQHGMLTFQNLCLRYKRDLDLVLKHLSLTIKGGQKIGIVGRTGAGKSSLTLALFRIVEASEGKILLDDMDIKMIGLHDLRSKLTIIPQDPILFSSSFRFNLDPFERHSDDEIWMALEQAHLKSFIASQPQKLSFMIQEGGENLSVGQRQLVCLARALLRKTKVLILDEATAAVDLETDDLVQKSIRKYFADCTILTIAHRINTIMDSDKIIVLSEGKIAEYDSPASLLENRDSLFYALAVDAGVA